MQCANEVYAFSTKILKAASQKKWVLWFSLDICLRVGFLAGEGNGNPLQYSCLANPTDGGAW